MSIKYKNLREDNDLKQSDIAQQLGVKVPTYSKWEQLANDMPLDKCNQLANYYNVSIDYLLGLTDTKQYDNYSGNLNPILTKERITKLRKEKKEGQIKLAKKLGFTKSTYAYYETGKVVPTVLKLLVIATYHHCSMDYLMGRIDDSMIKEETEEIVSLDNKTTQDNNGIKFKRLRKEKKLTQTDISKILNVRTNTYTKWEILMNDIPLEKCNTLANYYGVSIDYLLGLTGISQYNQSNNDIDFNTMRQRLREQRLEHNLGQCKLCLKVGLSQPVYSDIERGNSIPATFKLVDIISYYDASMDYILGKINYNPKKDSINY